jgi:hypothetical protein
MRNEREVWFQRATMGGWSPIHWKGYVLLLGGVGATLLLAGSAVIFVEHRGQRFIVVALACCAAAVGAITWGISLLHSRPWRDRKR